MTSRLIIALDFDAQDDVLRLIDAIDPQSCAIKIGNELFTHFGPTLVRQLTDRGFHVFLDLKYHDIPNTVAKSCKAAADLGVWMVNVHASGGKKMMHAAREALEPFGLERPLLIAVTVLTSFDEPELNSIGVNTQIASQVLKLALLAKDAGLDGVVSSAHEVKEIKKVCGADFLTVTPGIRLEGNSKHDQTRIMTPKQAILQGCDYLVIGRPVTQAPDPCSVIAEIQQSIQ